MAQGCGSYVMGVEGSYVVNYGVCLGSGETGYVTNCLPGDACGVICVGVPASFVGGCGCCGCPQRTGGSGDAAPPWRPIEAVPGAGPGLPPPPEEAPRPLRKATEHSNLFVGNLPQEATEEELSEVFGAYGTVAACRVFRKGRTCALVKMESKEEADRIVEAFEGKAWQVKYAEADLGSKRGKKGLKSPCDNLYVKGLPASMLESELRSLFAKAGKVLEMKIMRQPQHEECAALIRMASLEEAKQALQMLDRRAVRSKVLVSHEEPLELRVKCPLQSSKEELLELCKTYGVVTKCRMRKEDAVAMAVVQMATAQQAALAFRALGAPAKHVLQIDFASAEPHRSSCSQNVYVKGLPLGMPELQLRQVFSKYGKVLRLKVMEPGENSDCAALVQMSSVSEAQAAVEALNGCSLTSALSQMKVRYAGKDQQPGRNLYITGLPLHAKESQLRTCFAQCGKVLRMRLLSQPGRTEAHALVEMTTQEEAACAIQQLNGMTLQGQFCPSLVVRYASNPV